MLRMLAPQDEGILWMAPPITLMLRCEADRRSASLEARTTLIQVS
jgi:hypothetical protein